MSKQDERTLKLKSILSPKCRFSIFRFFFNLKRKSPFYKARENEKNDLGYQCRTYKTIWNSKKTPWCYLRIDHGIRWTDNIQYFPIRNTSNNTERSILFGVWKLYFSIHYCRSSSFNQERVFFMRKKLWNFYQLIC
jgi:hypothetical protein